MSKLESFSSQWGACVGAMQNAISQNPIPIDRFASDVGAMEAMLAEAELEWRAADFESLSNQLAELNEQRAGTQTQLEKARALGSDDILSETKRLKRQLTNMETLAALARANQTLDRFITEAESVFAARGETAQHTAQCKSRLAEIEDEMQALSEKQEQLEQQLDAWKRREHLRKLRNESLEQAQQVHHMWQALRIKVDQVSKPDA